MLELCEVGKSLGGRTIIESASLLLTAGEILCLSGPSGIGKSTLLEIMAGISRPDKGQVKRNGKAALMFQDDVLIPWLTAEEAIRYVLPSSMPERAQKERAAFWLNCFGLGKDIYPAAMSGGMRRRLSLARSFAVSRPLLLLDEPFAFLDAECCRAVARETAAHAGAGGSVVLTTHSLLPLEDPVFSQLPLRFVEVRHSPIVIRV